MPDVPESSYTRTAEGAYLAYQVLGEGPIDLVCPLNGGVLMELMWEEPTISSFMRRLASFARVVNYDPRGFGTSSRVDPRAVPAVQTWMDDIAAVMDAAGSERAAILVWGEMGLAAMLYAATYPRRVTSLVLVNTYARFMRSGDYPWGMSSRSLPAYADAIHQAWGTGAVTAAVAPSLVCSDEERRRWARIERLSATPDSFVIPRSFLESDVTQVLPAIQAPTLVISRQGDRHVRPEHSRFLAAHISGARLVELPGHDHWPFSGPAEDILDEVQEFLTGARPSAVLDRVLATVVFTDIVGSTEHAARLGDQRWRETLNRYDELALRHLERFRGRQVKTTGDGTLATFDGPARAVECARTLAHAVSGLGFELRAGVHTGEVELRGDDVAGVAVHIAARIAALAGAGQVVVSRTVTDLVVGSGIHFADLGDHELKGVPGDWRLFSVTV